MGCGWLPVPNDRTGDFDDDSILPGESGRAERDEGEHRGEGGILLHFVIMTSSRYVSFLNPGLVSTIN